MKWRSRYEATAERWTGSEVVLGRVCSAAKRDVEGNLEYR